MKYSGSVIMSGTLVCEGAWGSRTVRNASNQERLRQLMVHTMLARHIRSADILAYIYYINPISVRAFLTLYKQCLTLITMIAAGSFVGH